jgi:hypothetical protein
VPPPAVRGRAVPGETRLRLASWCAYVAGIGGIAGIMALLGFFALELQSADQPLGTISDLGTASVGLLIPAALALPAYLPPGLATGLLQAVGITAMAVTAVSGPLMVAGLVSYDLETPVSAVSSLIVVGWAAVASRMLRRSGRFRPRVTRLGPAIGLALVAGAVLVGAGLSLSGRSLTAGSLAGMSLPHQVLLWSGVVIGGTAWCLSAVWDLFLGQELARAADDLSRPGHGTARLPAPSPMETR